MEEKKTSARKETAKPGINRTESKSDTDKDIMSDSHTGRKPKRNVRKLISALLVVSGLLFILVPLVMTQINARRNDDIIDQFLKEAQRVMSDAQAVSAEDILLPVSGGALESYDPSASDPNADVESSEAFGDENNSDREEPPSDSENTSATAPSKKPLMSAEEIQKRMTGVLIIDKIDLKMVIMDGVDEETLRVAAGRMTETGNFDEIGNVVLAGHRSYTLGKYFNRLDELEPGDKIVVQTKSKTLEYEVFKKHIIEPDDFSITKQSDTEKILTLFTCHPVVIANQRLVVHARQIN